ncbi:hypothetical protein A6A06_16250 [Streptomyces sp. CB02923]|uniref:saccharopine dehydrogenase NADP-binding domain-containing protein n=1 Tax=Streptomyces sp. CB02923 TaxID=1718985 RepID=UPI00093D95BA|nr:saccharopine dehydrogenase NADP-binding domain-containing protein [Streptomyces sp. CB02923]OKI02565.1 hypothetical protein A6A06_16250 [Streptomyces sp. CB02923]
MTVPGAPLVGVLGGYGAVGAAAVRCLAAEGGYRLRIGGRRAAAGREFAAALPVAAEAMAVDATDDGSLARFSHGCDLVLNCAGPAYLLLDRARRAAFAAGADYADVMSAAADTGTHARRTAVLSAGLTPGLSGMLPGLLAHGLAVADRFHGGYAGLETFTRTGAADYLLSLEREYGTPLAEWRAGAVTGALQVERGFRAPGVHRPLTAYPYLPQELVRQARARNLTEARWYNAFDGTHLLDALSLVRAEGAVRRGLDTRVDDVVRASALDAAGHTPYHVLWARLDGTDHQGQPTARSVFLRAPDGSELTGAVGAFAAHEVLGGRVGAGVHQAGDVLRPQAALEWLRRHVPRLTATVSEERVGEDSGAGVGTTGIAEDEGVL